MKNQSQGVKSAKLLSQQQTQLISEAKLYPEEKRRIFFLTVYEPKETIYTDHTGRLPHQLIRGNKYQMILHEIY